MPYICTPKRKITKMYGYCLFLCFRGLGVPLCHSTCTTNTITSLNTITFSLHLFLLHIFFFSLSQTFQSLLTGSFPYHNTNISKFSSLKTHTHMPSIHPGPQRKLLFSTSLYDALQKHLYGDCVIPYHLLIITP